MAKTNVELISIVPFKEDGRWYCRLVYKYEDVTGKHRFVIPKAIVPFNQSSLPLINSYYKCALDTPYIDCYNSMPLCKSLCTLAQEQGIKEPAYFFDIVIEYGNREMTLDEIEKELGYKVKIVNKENNR